MKDCADIENSIVDYIDGMLSAKETEEIKTHITTCTTCKNIFEESSELIKSFSNEPIVQPSAKLKASFEQMLREEKTKQAKVISLHTKKSSYKKMFQIAVSVAILFTGYLLGSYRESKNLEVILASFKNEKQQFRESIMLAMIDNSSPSKRIKAVNYAEELSKPNTRILTALIECMQQDSNSNVRLSATEALSKFTDFELVRTSLVETLGTEKNPSIQIEIIQILVNIQEKRAIIPMKKILKQSELPAYLRTQVNIGIAKLI